MGVFPCLPPRENYVRALRAASGFSILAHGLALGFLGWSFPCEAPKQPLDDGITIELSQVDTVPEQAEQKTVAQEARQPPPASASETASPKTAKPTEPARPAFAPRQKPGKDMSSPKASPRPAPTAAAKPAQKTIQAPGAASENGQKPTSVASTRAVSTAAPAKVASTPPLPPAGASKPKPVYPELARKRNQEGSVLVRCQVSADGSVTNADIAKSSGYRLLDDAALKAVRKWRFRPATSKGAVVAGTAIVPVEFILR